MPEAVAPEFMVEGPHGSVLADPAKVPTPEASKPAEKPAERPEWLDEKFKSPEDLAKAYKELEQKLGKPIEQPAPTADEAKAKGVDLDALQKEYAEKGGKLSAESMQALAKAGFTEAHVKAYVAGIEAQQKQTRAEFAEVAGGEEQLVSVLEWANTALTDAEKKVYNDLVEAGNAAAAKYVLKDIVARYATENGQEPALLNTPRVPSTSGVKPFESMAQVVEAMQSPKYAKDPAYRAKVEERLAVSDL